MTDRISGGAFKDMVAFGAACIAQQKQAINDLNVFPVPDGDTGTNMSLTIQTAWPSCVKPARHRGRGRHRSPPPLCFGAPGATPASSSPCCSGAFPRSLKG